MNNKNVFERIEKLYDINLFKDTIVLIVGLGSGGGNVALQLAMSGIVNFILVDNDIIEHENVIRHICGSKYIGKLKVDAVEEVLNDRNPNIKIQKVPKNIMDMPRSELENLIKKASVVVVATDNEPSRYLLNEICVIYRIPHVTARVFTRGIGGEIFSYRPDGPCLACLEDFLERTKFRTGVREIDIVSQDERDKVYGMEIPEIKDSPGLNVDITFITSFHTRFVLEEIAKKLKNRPISLLPIDENYLIWGNRPQAPFIKNFQLQRVTMHKMDNCLVCDRTMEKVNES